MMQLELSPVTTKTSQCLPSYECCGFVQITQQVQFLGFKIDETDQAVYLPGKVPSYSHTEGTGKPQSAGQIQA